MKVLALGWILAALSAYAVPSPGCGDRDWALIPTETIDVPVAYLQDRTSGALMIVGKGPFPLLKSSVDRVSRATGATVSRLSQDGWTRAIAVAPNAIVPEHAGLTCDKVVRHVEIAAALESRTATLQVSSYACNEAEHLRILRLLTGPVAIWDMVGPDWPPSRRISKARFVSVRPGMCWEEARSLLGTPTTVRREGRGFGVLYSSEDPSVSIELIFDQARSLVRLNETSHAR